jgi:glycosyltransferase involved in cell wall biosynthesis
MKISYLITCSTETTTLISLLDKLSFVYGEDEVVVVADSDTKNESTDAILNKFSGRYRILYHSLNRNYGAHKNWGAEQCKGEYIFQIDGDELPADYTLGENLHSLLEANGGVDLIYVPRINDFKGVTEAHARQWGWRLTYNPRPSLMDRCLGPLVNWPDYQPRIFVNEPNRIKWDRRLHEKIEGFEKFATLPAEQDFALYHDKTIETQLKTNKRYNEWFTQEENQGHDVFSAKK